METTQGEAEGTCSVQPGAEKTERRPCSCLQVPHEGKMRGSTKFFSLMTSDWTQGNGLKLNQGRFSLGIRKRFFIQSVLMHRHRLPRDTTPSLTEFLVQFHM